MSELLNEHKAIIKVIGVGGGGGNAIAEMAGEIQDVEFWLANTDAMALACFSQIDDPRNYPPLQYFLTFLVFLFDDCRAFW